MLMAINDDESKANVIFIEFLYYGWPHVCLVTDREVKPGEELITDYGADYWNVHNILATHAWGPLDKLNRQRKREGQALLAHVEENNKRKRKVEAQNEELKARCRELKAQNAELKRILARMNAKQPLQATAGGP